MIAYDNEKGVHVTQARWKAHTRAHSQGSRRIYDILPLCNRVYTNQHQPLDSIRLLLLVTLQSSYNLRYEISLPTDAE